MATGDITYTQNNCTLDTGAFACGTIEIDADVAKNVIVGFVPTMIELYVKDTGATTIDQVIKWWRGMTAGYYWKTLMSTGAITLETSGGPTVYGDTSDDGNPPQDAYESHSETGQGFTVPAGLPSGLADGDMIYWKAWR